MVEITPEMQKRVVELLLGLNGFQHEKEALERRAQEATENSDPKEKQKSVYYAHAINMKTKEMEQMYFWGWLDAKGGHQV